MLPPPAGSRAAVEVTFRITPQPDDPFAPSGPGDVRVRLEDGREALAFLDQDLLAREDGQATRMVENGLPRWRAFLPAWNEHAKLTIVSDKDSWTFVAARPGHEAFKKVDKPAVVKPSPEPRISFPREKRKRASAQGGFALVHSA